MQNVVIEEKVVHNPSLVHCYSKIVETGMTILELLIGHIFLNWLKIFVIIPTRDGWMPALVPGNCKLS